MTHSLILKLLTKRNWIGEWVKKSRLQESIVEICCQWIIQKLMIVKTWKKVSVTAKSNLQRTRISQAEVIIQVKKTKVIWLWNVASLGTNFMNKIQTVKDQKQKHLLSMERRADINNKTKTLRLLMEITQANMKTLETWMMLRPLHMIKMTLIIAIITNNKVIILPSYWDKSSRSQTNSHLNSTDSTRISLKTLTL